MTNHKIDLLIKEQRAFFQTHQTKDISFRLEALKKLRKALLDNEQDLMDALWADFHKPAFESYSHELGQVLNELNLHIRKLKAWAKPERRPTPLAVFPSRSRIYKEPFGNVLIMSPWNYPVLLLVAPLVGAISAGNTVLLKPSPYLKAFSNYLDRLITSIFPREYIAVVHGGKTVNQHLLKKKWNYIFFTGSTCLGKIVMKAAAEHLTPVTLELGGKSPCIVDEDANLKLAAKRIVWGKFMNGGQTCIAPDYLLVHEKVKEPLLQLMVIELKKMYGAQPRKSPDFCRVVNETAFDRLQLLLKDGSIRIGGESNREECYIAPTIVDDVQTDFPIMEEEVFGPILPVMTFSSTDKAIAHVNSNDKPLAFYYFSQDLKKANDVLRQTSSGGGCINDTILHIANKNLPFGGVGNSGMGKYHGKLSFDIFSNQRSILISSKWFDIPLKYPPYGKKLGLIKFLLKL